MGKKFLCALICMLCLSLAVYAQETTAGVQGTVKDQQGAVVPNATVTVSSSALIGKRSATTDSAGNYHMEQLPPGVYTITVNAAGFAPTTQNDLRLDTGALPNIN